MCDVARSRRCNTCFMQYDSCYIFILKNKEMICQMHDDGNNEVPLYIMPDIRSDDSKTTNLPRNELMTGTIPKHVLL